ncbi:MAG: hypothetical protein KAR47_04005 [Planctomycetes bacterium]|nr:hypothetical protein [Planctomycetota bacterium]
MEKTDIGTPLTPDLLRDLGALDKFPSAPASFAPDGDFINFYRICTSDGYRGSSTTIDEVGFLKIQRLGRTGGGHFTLKIDQQTIHREAAMNTIDAEAECKNDPRASLLRWRVSSRLVTPEGEVQRDLDTDEECQLAGDRIEVRMNGRNFRREGASQLTCDWCLFEAVQRLGFKSQPPVTFNMLEGLSLLRRDHRLHYRGVDSSTPADGKTLHRFYQLGEGVLPYEYWLDEQHRLVMVVTHNRAYILDDKAQDKFAAVLDAGRYDYSKKKRSELKDLEELKLKRSAMPMSRGKVLRKGDEG